MGRDPMFDAESDRQYYDRARMLEGLQKEVSGLEEREQRYFEMARKADQVAVVLACDDSRAGIPQGIQDVSGFGRVLFDMVPSLGGGVSSEVLPAVVSRLISEGVDASRITVVTTQHGNSEEVNNALAGTVSNPTCGLRGVLKQVENGGQPNVPPALATHATETNKSSSIIENSKYVFEETKKLLREYDVRVVGGYYNHEGTDENGKSLELVHGVDEPISIALTEQTAWHERHQDPAALVVSVGTRAATLPDGVILPETVGDGVNNDFNSAGVDKDSFLRAVREQWYALSHLENAHGDHNFEHTNMMVCLCDGEEQIGWVRDFVDSDEFDKYFREHVRKLGGVYVVNLKTKKADFIAVN